MNFLRFILILLISTAIFFFVGFLNIKLIFSSADKAKSFLTESNLYPVVAAGIRDNLVKYSEIPAGQGVLIEVVNEAITENNVKTFVEDFTVQFFYVVNNPSAEPKITIHFSSLRELIKTQISKNKEIGEIGKQFDLNNVLPDRDVDLSKNKYVSLLRNINKYLIGSLVALLLFITLLFLSGSWSLKLKWLGASFLVSGIFFLSETALYYFGMSENFLNNLAKMSKLEDERFLMGVRKLVISIMSYQKMYYTIITISLILIAVILLIIGKAIKKEEVPAPVSPDATKVKPVPAAATVSEVGPARTATPVTSAPAEPPKKSVPTAPESSPAKPAK